MPIRRGYKLARFRFLRTLRMVRRGCPPECVEVTDFTVKEARHLLDHGEEGIAFEIVIGNLCEVAYPVSNELLVELRCLASRVLIDTSYSALLDLMRVEEMP
jgi:hypothetical protein